MKFQLFIIKPETTLFFYFIVHYIDYIISPLLFTINKTVNIVLHFYSLPFGSRQKTKTKLLESLSQNFRNVLE